MKFKTKKGRIVYGGGGIVPDIFVPLEVKKGEENLAYVLNSGLVGHFVFEQLDQNRKGYDGLDLKSFLSQFYSDKTIVGKFQTYLTKSGLEINVLTNDSLVKKYLSAEFARQLFGENQYYRILLKDDAMLKAILK